jgi:fucose permease
LETTANLWGSSYLVYNNNIPREIAASLASMFLIGLTVGRILNGFLATKYVDDVLIKLGQGIILLGIILLFIPHDITAIIGFIFIGLGCAPIYPSIMHSIPLRFGAKNSQLLIGLQMAFAYLGSSLMPPLFGALSSVFTVSLLPIFLLVILLVMFILHNIVIKKTTINNNISA